MPNVEARHCLEGMNEDEIILVFEQEQDTIRFPGNEMKRRGWRREEQREDCWEQECEYTTLDLEECNGKIGKE